MTNAFDVVCEAIVNIEMPAEVISSDSNLSLASNSSISLVPAFLLPQVRFFPSSSAIVVLKAKLIS